MKGIIRIGSVLLTILFLVCSCDIEEEPYIQGAENEKAILQFDVDNVMGVIDENAKTVTLTFPDGTDVSHLTPTIKVSQYATVDPASGVEQDFSEPVRYTVTAFNGTTAEYMVSAIVFDAENEKSILSFRIDAVDCEGVVDETGKTVTLNLPVETDVTQLVPTIVVSEGATVDPASGVAQDFSNPVVYTVTALNGSTAEYTVTALVQEEPIVAMGKTVLIKDFTGVRCSNCPSAAEYAHNLQHQLSEDHIFILGVHAGSLAQPVGQFPDFTTPEGTAWYANQSINPLFNVDYVSLEGGHALYSDELDVPVAAALEEDQTFEIRISDTYNESTRQLDVAAVAMAVTDVEGDFHVTACLVEDNIVGMQLTLGGLNQEYVFRNVFRGTLNGAEGQVFLNGQAGEGELFHFNFSTELNPDFNADECYLMVYVSDNSQGGKILQTAMKKIK